MLKPRYLRCLALMFALIHPLPSWASPVADQMKLNQRRYGIVSQAVLVKHNGELVFRGAEGATPDEIFPVYSLSKLFVSTLVMQLGEQGRIDLDAPASAYVRALPASWDAITVRQFMTHTSGVPEYFENVYAIPATVQAAFESLANKPLHFQPGTAARYTQTNYLVLTLLLEAQYGKPYPQIARERIIEPLHLEHTYLGASSLPLTGVATAYAVKDGKMQKAPDIAWPAYSYGHAELFSTVDNLARFIEAVSNGKFASKLALQEFWQAPRLSNGRPGVFAAGWEYGQTGEYRHVGHDGGAQVRVRLLYKDTLDGDNYIVIYLTNGSMKNVWSRVLLDSAMAAAAPEQFQSVAFVEKLIAYALGEAAAPPAERFPGLESVVNAAGYTIRDNLGLDAAIRVFAWNTTLFPQSANTWDSLAEAYQAKGDHMNAQRNYAKARELSTTSK
ncbi:serine hydrolase domain-containing protein [Oxalobacteraceae bacterium A2-2]